MMQFRLSIPAVLLAVTATLAVAQTAPRQQQQRPTWDASTITTVKGTVSQSREVGRVELVMLMVKTEAGPQMVLLGPEAALDPSVAKLAQGTEVEVTGSKVKMTRQEREHDVILASMVKAGGKEYRIRNDQGQLVDKDGKVMQRPKR
jgi:hypothetical protein